MESSFHSLESTIQSTSENAFSSKMNDEEAEIPDYEKKRLENIAEKKAMFEEKLRNAKLAVKEKWIHNNLPYALHYNRLLIWNRTRL